MQTKPESFKEYVVRQRKVPLITGTGRCGTAWLTKVLSELGLNAHHFCPWTNATPEVDLPEVRIHVYTEDMEMGQTRYALLVRNPYECIPSLTGMYYNAGHMNPALKAIARYWWVNATLMNDAEYILTAEDTFDTVYQAYRFATGERIPQEGVLARKVAKAINTHINVNAGPEVDFDWSIWPAKFLQPIHDMAAQFGYERPDTN